MRQPPTEINYKKLENGWGIIAPESLNLQPGSVVGVVKRDGEVKTETVKEVLYSLRGATICTIVEKPRRGHQKGGNKRPVNENGARTKRCRVCHGIFTREDLAGTNGSWNDSRCGCDDAPPIKTVDELLRISDAEV